VGLRAPELLRAVGLWIGVGARRTASAARASESSEGGSRSRRQRPQECVCLCFFVVRGRWDGIQHDINKLLSAIGAAGVRLNFAIWAKVLEPKPHRPSGAHAHGQWPGPIFCPVVEPGSAWLCWPISFFFNFLEELRMGQRGCRPPSGHYYSVLHALWRSSGVVQTFKRPPSQCC
jgi:hypothetical protein